MIFRAYEKYLLPSIIFLGLTFTCWKLSSLGETDQGAHRQLVMTPEEQSEQMALKEQVSILQRDNSVLRERLRCNQVKCAKQMREIQQKLEEEKTKRIRVCRGLKLRHRTAMETLESVNEQKTNELSQLKRCRIKERKSLREKIQKLEQERANSAHKRKLYSSKSEQPPKIDNEPDDDFCVETPTEKKIKILKSIASGYYKKSGRRGTFVEYFKAYLHHLASKYKKNKSDGYRAALADIRRMTADGSNTGASGSLCPIYGKARQQWPRRYQADYEKCEGMPSTNICRKDDSGNIMCDNCHVTKQNEDDSSNGCH